MAHRKSSARLAKDARVAHFLSLAAKQPALNAAQASAPRTWTRVWASASSQRPRSSNASDSIENDENVVKPPRKPVTSSRRAASLGWRPSTT